MPIPAVLDGLLQGSGVPLQGAPGPDAALLAACAATEAWPSRPLRRQLRVLGERVQRALGGIPTQLSRGWQHQGPQVGAGFC